MLATIGLVIGFGSSSNLAAAYGIAVSTTMVFTTLLAYIVARHRWGWNPFACVGLTLTLLLLMVDLAFFGANLIKIEHGGGNEALLSEGHDGMFRWRTLLFAFLARNAARPTTFFSIPTRRVMEIGPQIER